MVRADVCYLIHDTPAAHGVHSGPQQVLRMVYCEVKSVARTEYYAASNVGMAPSYVLKLSDSIEYDDELYLQFHDKPWKIMRTYMTSDGGIELTIQRSDING